MLKNYGEKMGKITTSNLPSTTLDLIKININEDLNLYDTPGLLDNGSLVLEASKEILKKEILLKELNFIEIIIKED